VNVLNFENSGYIIDDLPLDIFKLITEEISEVRKSKTFQTGLSGLGVSKQHRLPKSKDYLKDYLNFLIQNYAQNFGYMNTIDVLNKPRPLVPMTPWVNVQQRYEYLPMHIHTGVLSYTIWIDIPYEIEEELLGYPNSTTSCFQFLYHDTVGNNWFKTIPVSKNYVGKIMIFPSSLPHVVYPFYSVDGERISVSGNLIFDVDE
jgi:hypothetical protein